MDKIVDLVRYKEAKDAGIDGYDEDGLVYIYKDQNRELRCVPQILLSPLQPWYKIRIAYVAADAGGETTLIVKDIRYSPTWHGTVRGESFSDFVLRRFKKLRKPLRESLFERFRMADTVKKYVEQ